MRQTLSSFGGEWDRVADLMMSDLRESGHPRFRLRSALERGTLKRTRGGKLSFHFRGDYDTVERIFELLFLSISSVSEEQSQN